MHGPGVGHTQAPHDVAERAAQVLLVPLERHIDAVTLSAELVTHEGEVTRFSLSSQGDSGASAGRVSSHG